MAKGRKAVFLDRDGVIIDLNVDFTAPKSFAVKSVEDIKLLPGVEKISALKKCGYLVIVVSNQPDIALGKINEKTRKDLEKTFELISKTNNLIFDGIYYCHHHPNSVNKKYAKNCDCRKPKAGMLTRASKDKGIDLSKSWVIGDSYTDILAGEKAGCRTILLNRVWSQANKCLPNFMVDEHLGDAIDIILKNDERK